MSHNAIIPAPRPKGKLFFGLFALLAALILNTTSAFAQLGSVTLTVPTPNLMSNGGRYYLAHGATAYSFQINATNPAATALTDYEYFQLTIPTTAGNLIIRYTTATAVTTATIGATNVLPDLAITPSNDGNWTNLTFTFQVRFRWRNAPALDFSTVNASRTITAQVKQTGIATTKTDTKTQAYGISVSIKAYNFAQDGIAADGFISPTRSADFNVTGTIVYDLPGYNLENASDSTENPTSVSLRLIRRTLGTMAISIAGGATAAFSGLVPMATPIAILGNGYYWIARADFGGQTKDSPNSLALESNLAQVSSFVFRGGAGRGPTHPAPDNIADYYRAYGQTGTLIELNVTMQVSGGTGLAMHGDTTFNVRFTDGVLTENLLVTVPSGFSQKIIAIPYNNTGYPNFLVAANDTVGWSYQITSITGGAFELNQPDDGNGAAITHTIYWDNGLSPDADTGVTINTETPDASATSVTFWWIPLNTASGTDNGDLYEYRVYFRKGALPYRQWNGNDDSSLRFGNPPNINAGRQYTVIPDLDIFTPYDFYITAVDVFGNESPPIIGRIVSTTAYQINVSISDGIVHPYDTFTPALLPGDAATRPVRESNIRIEMSIITADDVPDEINVWYTEDMTATNIIGVGPAPDLLIFPGPPYLLSAKAERISPNKWVAYLPTNPTSTSIIKNGNQIRFVLETVQKRAIPPDIKAYSDIDASVDSDPNNHEWSFSITNKPDFKPWPTRILNNVITKTHRKAYPSYYLSEDADVTIIVYDIKGRPVATLLDSAFRKGGQNIKEEGWDGRNKSDKSLGVGLYYIQIKAKGKTSNKMILNSFEKVVIAK
ncbi:MAG: hypothetical protein EPN93_02245 [Spirochaetes bacterium]|nr:MAG: hypothetical protein EPN93_02245 [Spirochaetota bacterium]